jgi:hypothetical protein
MNRSTLIGSLHLPLAALVVGASALTQACAFGQHSTGSSSSELGGGSGGSSDGGGGGSADGGAVPEGGSSSFEGGATFEGGASGADAGSGSGSDGGYAYAYAFVSHKSRDRHHVIQLADGAKDTVALSWRDAAGVAPAADLWIDDAGKEPLQIASVNGHPFVRVGLDIVPLVEGTQYDLALSRAGNTIDIELVDASTHHVVATAHSSGDAVDVVLPGEFFRPSIVSDLN